MTKVLVMVILLTVMVVPLPAFASTVQLPATGQTSSYGTNDDGALQNGVTWPSPRFRDNCNGTVTDNLTGLIWLKNANCFGVQWTAALERHRQPRKRAMRLDRWLNSRPVALAQC
jgi:hypothetical protein